MERTDTFRGKTAEMSGREKLDYIITYYWYHLLGVAAVTGFFVFLILHFGNGIKRPEFTCVLVNQAIDDERDRQIRDAFAKEAEKNPERVVIDSGCQISYGEVRLAGINESSYEKFFFQWENGELDAVIMPESFYRYCRELGGEFRDVEALGAEGLSLYEEDGVCRAVLLAQEPDIIASAPDSNPEDALLLAFPATGTHEDACEEFIEYIRHRNKK